MKLPASPLFLAATLLLAGCGGGNGPTLTSPTDPAATAIYVTQANTDPQKAALPEILAFPSGASGDPSPAATLTLPTANLPSHVATDPTGNLYVATSTDLRVYAAGSSGSASPTRLIPANATTTLTTATALAADTSGNIYVAEQSGGIAIFSPTANGSVAPTRYLLANAQTGGGLSNINVVSALAVDSTGNLYVANVDSSGNGSVLVFDPTATGNIAPTRVLNTLAYGLAVDTANNLYASGIGSGPGGNSAGPNIAVYAPGASGTAAPARTISGANTGLGGLPALAVDAAANIYVVSYGNPFNNVLPANPTVLKFSATASGNVAPTSSFTSTSWNGPTSLAVH